jgi:NAD(P)-dependent dehydrogenase (short-subunit alcohol dehydrogenase family)
MPQRLQGKTAIITGAAGGIGSAMSRLFAQEGCAVVLADIEDEAGETVAEEIRGAGGAALYQHADISRPAEVRELLHETTARFGGLDILVNNAIYSSGDGPMAEEDDDVFDRTIEVCLKGPYLCTKHALPLLKARGGGSIITLSSVNALFGFGETAYTAAKGGLISMMRLVAADYGEWNIRSNIICPGTIATKTCMDYWERFPAGFAKLLEMYPLKRIGKPMEVAQYALFLASDESSFVTGSICVIDGGLLAGRKFEF